MAYIFAVESIRVSSTTFTQFAQKSTEFGELKQPLGLLRRSRSFKGSVLRSMSPEAVRGWTARRLQEILRPLRCSDSGTTGRRIYKTQTYRRRRGTKHGDRPRYDVDRRSAKAAVSVAIAVAAWRRRVAGDDGFLAPKRRRPTD